MDHEALWARIEAALDAHPGFRRIAGEEPSFSISRAGTTARIRVKPKGKAHSREVTGDGETPELATQDLINSLDIWSEVFQGK